MDPVALINLVIALPSAVLAVILISDRLKKKPKADGLVDGIKEINKRYPEVVIRIGDGHRVAINVNTIDSGEVLIEMSSKAEK